MATGDPRTDRRDGGPAVLSAGLRAHLVRRHRRRGEDLAGQFLSPLQDQGRDPRRGDRGASGGYPTDARQWEIEGEPQDRVRSFIRILVANRADIKRHGCPVGTLCAELAKLGQAPQGGPAGCSVLFAPSCAGSSVLGRAADADALAMHLLARSRGVATLANTFRDDKFIRREVDQMFAWLKSTEEGECSSCCSSSPLTPGRSRFGTWMATRRGSSAASTTDVFLLVGSLRPDSGRRDRGATPRCRILDAGWRGSVRCRGRRQRRDPRGRAVAARRAARVPVTA